jgi:acyl-CoA thioester hydrolase
MIDLHSGQRYNLHMNKFRFTYPVSIRYGDLDPQWHVNNIRFLSYLETARMNYLLSLGLFDGSSFNDLPFIVGDVHIRYLHPIQMTDHVMVSMGTTAIGTKSLTLEYEITSTDGQVLYATAETVMVAYDYHKKSSMLVSAELRKKIGDFEGRTF